MRIESVAALGGLALPAAVVAGGILIAGVVVACRSSAGGQGSAPGGSDALRFERVTGGVQSAIREECVRAAWSASELVALWAEHGKLQLPAPAPPPVDWEPVQDASGTRAALAVFLGNRASGGYSVEISEVSLSDEGRLVVHALEHAPAPGAMTTQAVTAPFELVLIDGAPAGAPIDLVLERAAR